MIDETPSGRLIALGTVEPSEGKPMYVKPKLAQLNASETESAFSFATYEDIFYFNIS